MLPLECKQEFHKIWPGDLVFDQAWPGDLFVNPTWPIFELGLDIVKTNNLIKFHQNRVAILVSSV